MAKEICAKLPSLREGCSNRSDMLHAKDCSIAGASLSPLSKFSCSDRSRFGHLQPDRKAAIRSDSRDCQSFHTESLQSYAELCRAMQSSLKSIGHLPGTDRTRMPWNGCARTWAAVSQWPGSETLVMCQLWQLWQLWQLHICVAYFTVTNHQHPSTQRELQTGTF